MKCATIAFFSFVFGVLTPIAIGHWSSTSVLAQGILIGGAVPLVPHLDASVPRVEPLHHVMVDRSAMLGVAGADARYVIDGLQLSNVSFDNPLGGVTLAYGGGAYSLSNVSISGKLNLELNGAAANTVNFLDSFGLLKTAAISRVGSSVGIITTVPAAPAKALELPKNKPITKKIKLASPLKGDIESQYDGTNP